MQIIVIGAGPAGLIAAAEAAKGGAKVFLFERNEKPGKKLYITGKGRCNVTNMCSPREFLESVVTNAKFLYSAINAFAPLDTVTLIESMGVKTKVERGNRVFPLSDKASDITKALVKNAEKNGVEIKRVDVTSVIKTEKGFSVVSQNGNYHCDKLILACGGVSYPTTGSNGDGFRLAQSLGHGITALRPALVPIKLVEDVKSLMGLSLKNVTATVGEGKKAKSLFGEMLFTSNGVSGPIILSLSSFINSGIVRGKKLYVDLKPALSHEVLDKRILSDFDKVKNKAFKNSLDELLPKSLIPYIVERSGIKADKPVNSVSKEERARIVALLKSLDFTIDELYPIDAGIVTAGGVEVSSVNPKTMESKIHKGLYFAGEMLDLDALTGGFNIQIALSTGFVAGKSATSIQE